MSAATVSSDEALDYRILERAYGPAIRHMDWVVEEGKTRLGGGFLHLFGDPTCRIRRGDYPYGGGGDVRLSLSIDLDEVHGEARVTMHFNAPRKGGKPAGCRVDLQGMRCTVTLGRREVGTTAIPAVRPGQRYDLSLITLDRAYEVTVNGTVAAAGTMPPPYTDNEGWTVIEATQCDVRLLSFEEAFIAVADPPPAWTREDLLYEETFTAESLRTNWGVNTSGEGSGIERDGDAFVFRHMCNGFLKQRFQGPIAVDCEATPVPTDEFPAGVTDAIFIWMIDRPEGDFFEFLAQRSREQEAGLGGLMPLPFYWVDFGGTNNVTTRFRRNPQRHMIRQFTDRDRLLARGRTYTVTVVQNGHFVEFHVDGEPWIQAYDSQPLTSGYIGFRAYTADLRVSSFRVWRLGAP